MYIDPSLFFCYFYIINWGWFKRSYEPNGIFHGPCEELNLVVIQQGRSWSRVISLLFCCSRLLNSTQILRSTTITHPSITTTIVATFSFSHLFGGLGFLLQVTCHLFLSQSTFFRSLHLSFTHAGLLCIFFFLRRKHAKVYIILLYLFTFPPKLFLCNKDESFNGVIMLCASIIRWFVFHKKWSFVSFIYRQIDFCLILCLTIYHCRDSCELRSASCFF